MEDTITRIIRESIITQGVLIEDTYVQIEWDDVMTIAQNCARDIDKMYTQRAEEAYEAEAMSEYNAQMLHA